MNMNLFLLIKKKDEYDWNSQEHKKEKNQSQPLIGREAYP